MRGRSLGGKGRRGGTGGNGKTAFCTTLLPVPPIQPFLLYCVAYAAFFFPMSH